MFTQPIDLYRNDLCAKAISDTPTNEYRRICDTTTEAAYAMVDAMMPGITSGDVDKIFRCRMEKAGLKDFSKWMTGHGLGTGHLLPRMRSKDKTVLYQNMTIDLKNRSD
ncbi:MAG: M24 family metallopeptidase [Candidatus Bathyarchaeia archaeon]